MNKFAKPLILLLVLLIVWVGMKVSRRDPSRPDTDKALVVSVDTSGIGRIEIARGAESVSLEHGVDGWMVATEYGPKPAEDEAVTAALVNLNGISTTDVISHNPEKQQEFMVDDASGTRVSLFGPGGAVIEELIVGKLGGFESQQAAIAQGQFNENQFHSFIRRAGTDRVFKVQGFFGGLLGIDPQQWREHDILKFHPAQLKSFTATTAEHELSMQLNAENTWEMVSPGVPDGMQVDSTAVFRLISALGSFRASSLIDTTVAGPGFEQPVLEIEAVLYDGTSYKVSVGAEAPEEQNLYYCRSQGSDQLFTVAEFRMDQVNKPPQELLIEKAEEQ
jgi:hypothetical protein